MAKEKTQKVYKMIVKEDRYELVLPREYATDNRQHSIVVPKPFVSHENGEVKTLRKPQVEKMMWEQVAEYYKG